LHGDSFVTVNQEINGGRWNKLGVYEFFAGSGGFVELSNAPDGNSCADAIRLAPNKTPTANNQVVSCFVNIDANFTLTGSDPDDDDINFTLLSYPEHGDLLGAAPDLTYRPDPNYLGSDSFTFEVDDNWIASMPAPVTIDVLPRTPASQIIDNRDQNTAKTGSWSPSTGPNPWAGESLYSSGAATFRWIPLWDLPKPVSYKVYTWWTALSSRGYNVPYRISHDQGITEIPVNQMTNGGDWHFLGNYIFSAGPSGYVEVADTNTGNSCADAVKLVRNYGPTATDQQALAFMNTLSPITLYARDQDDTTFDFVILSDPNHGDLSGTVDDLWYMPDPGYLGADSFTFKASDGALETTPITMFIEVVEGYIELSASELIYYGLEGDGALDDQVFTVRNSGGGSLDWQITEDCGWLWVVPASGSSTGEEDMVTVHVDVTGLAEGVYQDELVISDPDAHNSPQSVAVTVNVLGSALKVPSQFSVIQDAIDYALDGSIIIVADGVYTGEGNRDLDFKGKEIILRSVNGPDNCTIDCQGSAAETHRGFHFHTGETANSVLDGFTITGGWCTEGAGIFIEQCHPTIRDCIITGNVTTNYGGGVRLRYGGPTFLNCDISHNQSKFGGGVYDIYSTAAFINCLICDNVATSTGGALRSYDGDFSLVNCTLSGNTAPTGGGLYVTQGDPVVKNSIIFWNLPDEIHQDGSTLTITYSDVRGDWTGAGNLNFDPCFVKAPPDGDYHLQSQAGRWDQTAGIWIADPNTSIGIDAGDPVADYHQELWPDGTRINMGAYGNTAQAGMSLSSVGNVADLNDDGTVNYDDWRRLVDKWRLEQNLLPADLNRDGRINIADLQIFSCNWLWHK